jgi:hypothetical protein
MSDLLGDVLVPPDVKLTARQRYALRYIAKKTLVDDIGLGAFVHSAQKKHYAGQPCEWCKDAGHELGRALRNKGLVKYSRKLGGWVLANRGRHTAHGASGPGELPED